MTETGHTERVVMPAEFWGGPADGWVGGVLEPIPSVLTFPFTQARAGATFAPDSRVPLGSGRYELVTSSAGDPIRYVLGRIRYVHRAAP